MVLNALPLYPSAGRYVLRLHRDSLPQQGLLSGRIEHVVSGEATDFASAADLIDWLTRHAAQECERAQAPGPNPSPKDTLDRSRSTSPAQLPHELASSEDIPRFSIVRMRN